MEIGIITHYYNSENYGGNLQAYALCELLKNMDVDAEQISYNSFYRTNDYILKKFTKMSITQKFHKIIRFCEARIKNIILKFKEKKIIKHLEQRRIAIRNFNKNSIPHSTLIYNTETILEQQLSYDVYITGSDQVWNPICIQPAYLLDFVPSDRIKFSYAASISQNELTPEQSAMFKRSLADYIGISVREQNAVTLLQDASPVPVEWVLDPTLLLTREQWDEICSKRVIDDEYIFCYFLGDDINERIVAEHFAKQHDLRTITFPHLLGHYRTCDAKFGDEKLYDITPNQFISLIKYAKYVFTDSFHATVFSGIYNKQYFVFERSESKSLGSRIYSLTSLFENEDHFCDTPEKATLSYIDNLAAIDYTRSLTKFEEMKKKSISYLKSNLSKSEELMIINEN